MKIVTSEQMRRIESRSEQVGVSTDALMERAGLAVARRVQHHIGHLVGVPVVALVGPGNNGGDGLVAARHLHRWGARVLVYICTDRREPDPKLDIVRDQKVPVVLASEDHGLSQLKGALTSAHAVVDAVLGTGVSRAIGDTLRAIFEELGQAKDRHPGLRTLALDVPSGLDPDSGLLDPATPEVDVTLALGYPKVGHFTYPGAANIGALDVLEIGIPPGLDGDVALDLMTSDWAKATLPARPATANKGSFGRVLIVAGSRNYVGAASLAAAGAARVGAGLVTVAIAESLRAAVAARAPEPTYIPLAESSPGVASADAAATILEGLSGYDALLLGCGIGQAPPTIALVERVLYSAKPLPPTVVDADGLNILAATQSADQRWWGRFSASAIVTPHPGEMSRLTGDTVAAVQGDRIGSAVESAARWNKVAVLKGAHTIVAAPDGTAMLSPFANPGLASAGTGDVLSGAIAGLLSQGLTLGNAAALGVYLHGSAGERVRAELGDTGMVAGDLLLALPRAISDLRGGGTGYGA